MSNHTERVQGRRARRWRRRGTTANAVADVTYEVSFTGTATDTLRAAFDDCRVVTRDGTTTLRCAHDALRDVLERIQDFGLELRDIRLVASSGSDEV